jgi:DNA-binding LytR/AlgR family response regulator
MKNELLYEIEPSVESRKPSLYDKIEKMLFDFKINQEQEEQFFSSIEEVVLNFNSQFRLSEDAENKSIFIKTAGFYIKIKLDSVILVKSQKNYIHLTTDEKEYRFRGAVKDFLSKLPYNFVRINKGFIANCAKIENFNTQFISINSEKISISKSYKK